MTHSIKVDFVADMRAALVADMVAWGHTVDASLPLAEVAVLYANLKRRRIEPQPRKVHVAADLIVPPARQAGYELVTKKATNGDDMNPHLSKTVLKKAYYDDMMLNDWVMHHIHLGTAPDKKTPALMERTGELLFAMVDSENIYFIAVGEHGDWADQKLFETARHHWSHLFQELKGLTVNPVSEEDTKALRAAGVFVVQAGPSGVPVLPRGGGYATSGRSLDVTRNADVLVNRVRTAEATFAAKIPAIVAEATRRGLKLTELEFHLLQNPDFSFFARDEKHGIDVRLE